MPAPTYLGGNNVGQASRSGRDAYAACMLTFAIAVPAGTNFLMVNFCGSMQSAGATGTPTFNGVAMGAAWNISTTGWNRRYIWYLLNPSIGTYNFSVSFGNALNFGLSAVAACFGGVDTSNPFAGTNTGAASGYTWSSSITSDPLYYVYNAHQFTDRTADEKTSYVNSPAVHYNYARAGYDDDTGSPQGAFSAAAGKAGAAGTNTITWNFPYGSGGNWYAINLRGAIPPGGFSQSICLF